MGNFTTVVDVEAIASDQPQFIRKISLVAGAITGEAIDLSELQIKFSVTSATVQTPRYLEARLYNVSPQTLNSLQNEFAQVQLKAGYQGGPFGIIFNGLIAQIRRGRENNTDSYVDIIAADADYAHNQTPINLTLEAGWTRADQQKACVQELRASTTDEASTFKVGYSPEMSDAQAPRGLTMWGMTRDELRRHAEAIGAQWSIEDQKVFFVDYLGYIPGDAIVLNSTTGLIGVPVQTIDGVNFRCLLSPNMKTGRLVQINNSDINSTTLVSPVAPNDPFFLPNLAPGDGIYKVYKLKHIGDTRNLEWYTEAICVAVNGTSNVPITSTFRDSVPNGH